MIKKSDSDMRELGKMIDAFLAENDLNEMAEAFFKNQQSEEKEETPAQDGESIED